MLAAGLVLASPSQSQSTMTLTRLTLATRPSEVGLCTDRPVLFVADVIRALRFQVDMLGLEKSWHEGDGAGGVCQVRPGECEIIPCEDATRKGEARLFIELTADGHTDLQGRLPCEQYDSEKIAVDARA